MATIEEQNQQINHITKWSFGALWWWPILFLALFIQIQLGCVPAKKQSAMEEPPPSITGIVVDVEALPDGSTSFRTIKIEFEDGRIFVGEDRSNKALLFKKNRLHVIEYDRRGIVKEVTIIEEE